MGLLYLPSWCVNLHDLGVLQLTPMSNEQNAAGDERKCVVLTLWNFKKDANIATLLPEAMSVGVWRGSAKRRRDLILDRASKAVCEVGFAFIAESQ